MTRRRRKTAAEIAGRSQKGGLFTIGMIAIGLIVVIYLKLTLGDSDSELLNQLTGDPELVLPRSVLDAVDAGLADTAQPVVTPVDAGSTSAPTQ